MYPGPTFEARRGRPIAVRWRNQLPTNHILQVAPTIHGAEPPIPEVRTVVHVHGLKVLPQSDGYPEAWFTNGFAQTGPTFERQIYHYPNDQAAAGLWYHDHALGITRLNQYSKGNHESTKDRKKALPRSSRTRSVTMEVTVLFVQNHSVLSVRIRVLRGSAFRVFASSYLHCDRRNNDQRRARRARRGSGPASGASSNKRFWGVMSAGIAWVQMR